MASGEALTHELMNPIACPLCLLSCRTALITVLSKRRNHLQIGRFFATDYLQPANVSEIK